MIWRSALAEGPARLRAVLAALPSPLPDHILSALGEMVRSESAALARLEALLRDEDGTLPGEVGPPADWHQDPAATWSRLRRQLLVLLDRVDMDHLLASARLPSGQPLSPYRLAGELADHDVRMVAWLRVR